MSDDPPNSETARSPVVGRLVAGALAGLFGMVAFGVFAIWRHERRQQDWRDQINAAEPFNLPTNRPVSR